ncbi:LysR family transcriptional regulator [uncultured Veillonella sp.]|uniref:LysR family transcriptional regulator n=1 Tax=uncultured Veillonella sp. TaxID=159268 RepID=UPI0025E3A712|nr:LysR family transcriptional regulator [uncultured Veillonella sp.]MDY3973486.1 LysR family transcriptional regulator [Veillonella caviae]
MLTQLRYFLAVVKYHNFSEAAEACHISQSAISQQIRALERELGVELLWRHNRTFSLTPAGEQFYQRGIVIVSDYEKLCNDIKRIHRDTGDIFHLGYLRGYRGPEIEECVATFYERHPDVEIHVTSGTHEELYWMLKNETIQVAFNDQRRVFADSYVNVVLRRNPMFVELAKANPLSDLQRISFDDLRHTPCILLASKEQEKMEAAYYHNDMGVKSECIFVENMEEAHLLVLSNRGFMIVEGGEGSSLYKEKVARVPLYNNEARINRTYGAFASKEGMNGLTKEFIEIMETTFGASREV